MSILRLDQTKQLFSGGKELASAWLNGQRVWAKPSNDPFPQLSGDFIHVRMEDAAVKATTGIPFTHRGGTLLPTTFNVETTQPNPVYEVVNGVNFLKMGRMRGLKAIGSADAFPFQSGFSVWGVIKPLPGSQNPSIFGIGKGATSNSYATDYRSIGSGNGNSYVTFTPSDDTSKAEVQHYVVPAGASDVRDATLRVNGVAVPSTTTKVATGAYLTDTRNLNLNGTLVALAGTTSMGTTVTRTHAIWRDLIFKLGPDFTDAERAALQEYGQARIKGLI